MNKREFKEEDMYPPIKAFFASMGYDVKGEVVGCDVTMSKDGVLAIIEMKKSFNMTLMFQLMDRQSITEQVYAAIPAPSGGRNGRAERGDFAKIKKVCEKMGFGLIAVDVRNGAIEIAAFPPVPGKPSKSKTKERNKNAVLKEMGGRSADLNAGGTTKRKLATAYREAAVAVACSLRKEGEATAKGLREKYNAPAKTSGILRDNYYGWFEKVGSFTYRLSAKGLAALDGGEWRGLVELYADRAE